MGVSREREWFLTSPVKVADLINKIKSWKNEWKADLGVDYPNVPKTTPDKKTRGYLESVKLLIEKAERALLEVKNLEAIRCELAGVNITWDERHPEEKVLHNTRDENVVLQTWGYVRSGKADIERQQQSTQIKRPVKGVQKEGEVRVRANLNTDLGYGSQINEFRGARRNDARNRVINLFEDWNYDVRRICGAIVSWKDNPVLLRAATWILANARRYGMARLSQAVLCFGNQKIM
ncbi:NSP4 [Rotavirus K]|nr:NSP4 [Rotavirus K]